MFQVSLLNNHYIISDFICIKNNNFKNMAQFLQNLKFSRQHDWPRTYWIFGIITVNIRIIRINKILGIENILTIEYESDSLIGVWYVTVEKPEILTSPHSGGMIIFQWRTDRNAKRQNEINISLVDEADDWFLIRGLSFQRRYHPAPAAFVGKDDTLGDS